MLETTLYTAFIMILIFRQFHFRPMPHPHNVRKRIKQVKDYIHVTPGMYLLD